MEEEARARGQRPGRGGGAGGGGGVAPRVAAGEEDLPARRAQVLRAGGKRGNRGAEKGGMRGEN